MINYTRSITLEPGKRSGKRRIRGLRITVYDVLSYLAAGMTTAELPEDFPMLTEEDVLACLNCAAGNQRAQTAQGRSAVRLRAPLDWGMSAPIARR